MSSDLQMLPLIIQTAADVFLAVFMSVMAYKMWRLCEHIEGRTPRIKVFLRRRKTPGDQAQRPPYLYSTLWTCSQCNTTSTIDHPSDTNPENVHLLVRLQHARLNPDCPYDRFKIRFLHTTNDKGETIWSAKE